MTLTELELHKINTAITKADEACEDVNELSTLVGEIKGELSVIKWLLFFLTAGVLGQSLAVLL